MGEVVKTQVLGGVLVHVDLLDDDALLAHHLFLGEVGVQKEVGEEFKALFGVFGRRFAIETGRILAREGVDLRAERVECVGDLERRARRGALELHMLDEVGNAVLAVALERRPRADENSHRDGEKPFHALDDDLEPVL